MGCFNVGAKIENFSNRSRTAVVTCLLVDTGFEYTWISTAVLESIGIKREKKDLQFIMVNGTKITRSVGFAVIRVNESFTVEEVVFAEKGDMTLLVARTLNVRFKILPTMDVPAIFLRLSASD
jgi:predicted aspartyl protease